MYIALSVLNNIANYYVARSFLPELRVVTN